MCATNSASAFGGITQYSIFRFFEGLADRLVADRVHDLQLHDLVRQQPQAPVGEPLGWWPQPQRDDLGLLLAVERLGARRVLAGLAVESDLKAQRHEPLADVLDGLGATANGLGDLRVGPGRTVGISVQKDLRAAHLLGRALELLDHRRQRDPLGIREADDILLLHDRTSGVRPSSQKHASTNTLIP
jgi:hypothetical protein